MPQIGEILREGKGKKVYATDDPDKAIVFFEYYELKYST